VVRGVYSTIVTHFVLIVIIFFTDVYPVPKFRVWGAFIGSLLMILMIFTVSNIQDTVENMIVKDQLRYRWKVAQHYLIWLDFEWLTFVIIIFSQVFFLMIRSFVRLKVNLDRLKIKKQLNNIDSISASRPALNLYTTF
jgi:hypothetical protein